MTTASLPPRRRSLILGALLALVLVFGGSARLHAQSIAVMVNGEPITAFDIEQRAKLNALTGGKTPDRKAVLDELIDEKLKIKEEEKQRMIRECAEFSKRIEAWRAEAGLSNEQHPDHVKRGHRFRVENSYTR